MNATATPAGSRTSTPPTSGQLPENGKTPSTPRTRRNSGWRCLTIATAIRAPPNRRALCRELDSELGAVLVVAR